jgi:5-methylcytosine-specific restriction endonuclease McrA
LKQGQKKSSKKLKASAHTSVRCAKEVLSQSSISIGPLSQNAATVITKSERKKAKPNLRHFLTNKLRRISYQWAPRKQAIVNARVERGVYKCASCEKLFGPKEIQLDHKIPVVDEEVGFTDWNTYIERLFCDVDNFQVLCIPCHEAKTFFEQEIRKQVKREKIDDEEDI